MEEHQIEYNQITFNHFKINFKPPEQGGTSSVFALAVVFNLFELLLPAVLLPCPMAHPCQQ